MKRIGLVLLTGAVLFAAFITVQRVRASGATASADLADDGFGRFTLPVYVNGEGPFPFMVDTGAPMSCVSPALVEKLRLSKIPGMNVNVQGSSGAQQSSMYLGRTYRSPMFDRNLEPLVGLLNRAAVEHGVIGMNIFKTRRIEFDMKAHKLTASPSGPLPSGFSALPLELESTHAMTTVEVDGVQVKAIIDTGARRTFANTALREKLGVAADDPRLTPVAPSQGATQDQLAAYAMAVKKLKIANAALDSPTLNFADLAVFKQRHIDSQPAILLGMDLMRKLSAVAIDYPRAELQIRP